jgi:penicillin-binding protein 1C
LKKIEGKTRLFPILPKSYDNYGQNWNFCQVFAPKIRFFRKKLTKKPPKFPKTAQNCPKSRNIPKLTPAISTLIRKEFMLKYLTVKKYLHDPNLSPPALCAGFFLLLFLLLRFSPYGDLKAFLEQPCSTRFYDRRANLVQIIPLEEGIRREYISIEDIPSAVIQVFISAEDERFFCHLGVDPLAVLRAASQNIRSGRRVSGASTITMQLARIISGASGRKRLEAARLTARRNIFSKTAEIWNAFRLETRFSKKEILELYFNSIPFGFQTEGIASAARNFFSSHPALLTPAETFCLAVIPRRPAMYNPLTEKAACIEAARKLARRFEEDSRLSSAFPLFASLNDDDWNTLRPSRFIYPQYMPHLVRHVHSLTGKQLGRTAGDIDLSADLELQLFAEDLIFSNIRRYASSRLNNGAAIVIDNRTGEVLAWVGSADYNDENAGGQIDGVLAKNQMGSSMKPFLYALALEHGFKPSDVLADIPSKYGTEEIYIPRNFNNRFNGPVLFRTALASSLNIPAVDLLYRLGVKNYGRFLVSAGFDLDMETVEHSGLGLALGNAPVSLAELAAAFCIFPRDGQTLTLRFSMEETAKAPAKKTSQDASPIISADTARLICSMLSDRQARLLAFGRAINFETPFPAMFKTGTANQFQSIVALGATTRFTAAVWMGNFTGETVIGRTGSSIPASAVRALLMRLHSPGRQAGGGSAASGPPAGNFSEPSGWEKLTVCALSGMQPSGECPSVIEEYFPVGESPRPCSWHNGGLTYPPEYQSWFLSQHREGEIDYGSAALEIITPKDNYVFLPSRSGENSSIPVEVIGGADNELLVEHNGKRFTVQRPFVFFLPYTPGHNTLTVINGDERDTVQFSAN